MKKKIISLVLVFLLAVSYLTVLSVADGENYESRQNVITPELQEVIDSANSTDKIPVSVWTTEIDSEKVEQLALEKTGFNKDSIRALVDQGKIETVTLEDVDKYIAAERAIYSEMQNEAHQNFIKTIPFLAEACEKDSSFVSSYAPMMIVELTKAEIKTLAKNNDVKEIYYSPDREIKEEMDTAIPSTRADYTRDNGHLDGTGIRIGTIDLGTPFPNASIPSGQITRHEDSIRHTIHATMVSEIIMSNGEYKGVVPNATLYSAGTQGWTNGFVKAVDWLVSKNVHIINMSSGISSYTGQYTDYEKWTDHIANNHSIHFVKSAGNSIDDNPNSYISAPGLAYNVITVGAIDDNGTLGFSDDILFPGSCYVERALNGIMPPNKPDLVAPGVNIATDYIPSGDSGTSFSTPIVTGIVAQLIQQMPALATLQDLMKAILTASISHSVHQYDSDDPNFDKFGAGVVNAQDCTYTNYRGTFASSYFTSSQSNSYREYSFTATSADSKIRISLAWIKNVLHSGIPHSNNPNVVRPLADLDLVVIAPDGTTVPLSNTVNADNNTNLVVMQFNPATYGYGTYKVRVFINDSTGANTYFGLVWW